MIPIAFALSACACSFVSLEHLTIDTNPAHDGAVLPAGDAVSVAFSIEPDRTSAEHAFKLSSAAGTSAGDFTWTGNGFSFSPVPPLKKGYLWTLSVIGAIKAKDGRSFDVSKSVSFFSGSSSGLMTLDSFSPAQGSTVGTDAALILDFSRAVDPHLFRSNFILSPSTDYDLAWSADCHSATLSPKPGWRTLSTYAWQVKADLADEAGVPMACPYAGGFVVQAEGTAPALVSVGPALFADGRFSPLSVGLDKLGYRDAIYLRFDKEVTRESVSAAVKITPAVKGRVLQDGPTNFAFVPEEGFAAGTIYKLCVQSGVADLAGNTMREEYLQWFSPQVVALRVAAIHIAGDAAISDFGDGYCYGFTPQIPDESALVALEFSSPIVDAAQRQRTVVLVSCSSLFPAALSPELKSAQWVSDTRLELSYAGFSPSTLSKTYYYKLLLPGGVGGIGDGAGGTMEADVWLVLFTR
jgi:hypothetical protein